MTGVNHPSPRNAPFKNPPSRVRASHNADSQSPLTAVALGSTEPALMSPITPGETPPQPHEASLPSATGSTRGSNSVPPPSLPSPAPSAHNLSDGPVENPPRVAPSISPITRPAQPAQVQSSTPEGMNTRYSNVLNNNSGLSGAANAASQSAQIQQSPGPSPTLAFNALGNGTERRVDQFFWSNSVKKVDFFVQCASQSPTPSGNVDMPRTRLLKDACEEQDLLYLAFHQIYCMHTCDPGKTAGLLNLNQMQVRGFEAIKQLLVDNQQASPAFLQWSVNFPCALSTLVHYPEYRGAVQQLSQSLGSLAERWIPFDQQVRSRGYPPLIDELVNEFGATSSVLLQIIFLSMCRRIHGTNHGARLRELFLQNKRDYNCRFLPNHPPPSEHQMRLQNKQLTDEYIKIRSLPAPTPPRYGYAPTGGQRPIPRPGNPRAFPATSSGPPVTQDIRQTASPYSPTPNAYSAAATPVQASYFSNQVAGRRVVQPQNADGTSSYPRPQVQNRQASRTWTRPGPPPVAMNGQPIRQPLESAQGFRQVMQTPAAMATGAVGQGVHVPVRPQQQQQHRNNMLLPPPGAAPPNNARPNPLRLALHQAHLRDPVKRLIDQGPEGEGLVELFQYLTSYLVPPALLGRSECLFNWKIPLSSADCERFPRFIPTAMGHRPTRVFRRGCRTYHLRCIKASPSTGAEDLDSRAWSVAESVWPSVIYIFINGVEHFVRRKVHNGKDLPLDITHALREGENEISFHFLRNDAESKDALYALAVEVMDVSNVDQIKQLVQILPAAETNERVQKHLSSSGADEELSIVNDDLSVNLLDPFTARVFNTPARGVDCRHLECFDLDTYLMTKASKSGKGPMDWNWRCPICDRDARPQSLVIDNYLVDVRADLERKGQLEDAKGIRIKGDGTWELKTDHDIQTAEGRDLTPRAVPAKRKLDDAGGSPPAQRLKTDGTSSSHCNLAAAEVIELD